jgi:type II secretory pathway pseudopilin PulG
MRSKRSSDGRSGSRVRGLQIDAPTARRSERGFSLLEIALVVLAIGILFAGVLSGRELITQAEIKSVVTEFNSVFAAYHTYGDRYGLAPGDDSRATQRWVSAIARDGNGDGRISGTYEAAAPAAANLASFPIDSSQGESLNFWWHMRLAELVAPATAGQPIAAQPQNTFGGLVGVQMDGAGLSGFTLCESDLPGKVAEAVDAQLDDMDPRTGLMRAAEQTQRWQPLATTTPATRYEVGSNSRYIVCRSR